MRILGIDPGYGIVGWSVIDSNFKIIGCDCIRTPAHTPIEDRLFEIHRNIQSIIETYKPDCAALEKLYFAQNTTTALDVAKSIGVIMLSIKMNGLSFDEYFPLQVKTAITGYGRASKEQMQTMIMRIFNIDYIPKPDDAADALAIAVCHSLSMKNRIKQQIVTPPKSPLRGL